MAVKPITNKQVVSSTLVNRAEQKTTRDRKARGGNSKTTFVPGKDFTKGYSVTLKDIDTSIISYVKNVIKPAIKEANEIIKVPVMYGNEERWKSARKRGYLRDKNNAFILPLVMLKRTEVSKNDDLPFGMDHDVQNKYAQIVRHSSWSKTNRYDNFSVQTGIQPVMENFVTGMPDYVDVTYQFILWTSYIEQMNPLVETFVEHDNKYWGDSTDYKFLSKTSGISDASEMSVDTERLIKSEFTLTTKAYLLPENTTSVITNKISQLQKNVTPSKVKFNFGKESVVDSLK